LAGRRPAVFLDYDAPRGTGIFVERADDPEVAERTTAADYILHGAKEVERFLDTLAR
jgi:trehalose 6-phosphate phosphatase